MTLPENITFTSNGRTYELNAKDMTNNQNGAAGAKKSDYSNSKEISIFTNVFDTDGNGTLDKNEAKTMTDTIWNVVDENHDGEITEKEAKGFLAKYGDKLKNVSPSKFLEFLSKFGKEKAEETTGKTKWSNYTVQNGESYKNLIIRSLKAQGIKNPTAEQIKKGMEEFEAKNPNAVKTSKKGVKYLLVGEKVQVAGGLEDKNNADEQIQAWSKTVNSKKITRQASSAESTQKTRQGSNSGAKYEHMHVECKDEKVVQVDKDGSYHTRMIVNGGESLYKTHYDKNGKKLSEVVYDKKTGKRKYANYYRNGKQVKSLFYNDKNQCNEVEYYDAEGRVSHRKYYHNSTLKSSTYNYTAGIATHVRRDGSKYYYKIDKDGRTLYKCDKNGKKI